MVLGVFGADYCARFVDAELGLYAGFGSTLEEAEDVLAVLVFLLLCFVMLLLLFGSFLVGTLMYCLVDFFV